MAAPAWSESFYGRWDRSDGGVGVEAEDFWRVEVPVAAHGMTVGKLTLVGSAARLTMVEQLRRLTAVLPDLNCVLRPLPGQEVAATTPGKA